MPYVIKKYHRDQTALRIHSVVISAGCLFFILFLPGSDHLYDYLEQHLILPVTAKRKGAAVGYCESHVSDFPRWAHAPLTILNINQHWHRVLLKWTKISVFLKKKNMITKKV